MKRAPIRTLLVDDHAVVRSGCRAYLGSEAGFDVVGEAASADAACRAYRTLAPDLVIMDVVLAGSSGIEASRRILAHDPAARILAFAVRPTPVVVKQALDAGVLGVVGKESSAKALCEAARAVAAGGRFLEGRLAQALVFAQQGLGRGSFATLTPREFDVVQMLLAGMAPAQIAAACNLSAKTVANVLSAVRTKLAVQSDIQLVKLAAEVGLVPWIDTAAAAIGAAPDR